MGVWTVFLRTFLCFLHGSLVEYARDRLYGRHGLYSKTTPGANGCTLWEGTLKQGTSYGTVHLTFPSNPPYIPDKIHKVLHVHRAFFLLHFIIENQVLTLPQNLDNYEISHLCHKTLCVNIKHLQKETHEVNMARNHCASMKSCSKLHQPFCWTEVNSKLFVK